MRKKIPFRKVKTGMKDWQQQNALQAQINRAANNVIDVKNLVNYVNKELRQSQGLKPLNVRWDNLRNSLEA